MIKNELIELLKDDEIKTLIQNIVNITDKPDMQNSEEVKRLEEQISNITAEKASTTEKLKKLQTDWDNSVKQLAEIVKKHNIYGEDENMDWIIKKLKEWLGVNEEELQGLNNEIKVLKNNNSTLENKNTELEETIESYRNNFEEELKVYAIYQDLSADTKESLKGIFKDESIKGFVACGIQEKNISSLWDYIKDEIIEEKNSDNDKLKTIFSYLFKRFTSAYPVFELQNVNNGDTFDTEDHIRHSSSSRVNGDITDIIFKGWINNRLNRVIKKSIVKMG